MANTRPDRVVVVGHIPFLVPAGLNLVKKLGSGAYGTVAAFTDEVEGRHVAVKKVSNAFNDLIDAKRIVREVKLLQHFSHDNVVSILDIFKPPSPEFEDIYICMDLMDTDLHRVIYSNQPLTSEHQQYFLYQCLLGLNYVHSANVIHRDLKPANILVNKNCELKICDFGLARGFDVEDDPNLTHYVVTRWYRAPEVILTARDYSKAIDVWAVGCILAEIVARKPLFQGRDPRQQVELIVQAFGQPPSADMDWLSGPANASALRFLKTIKGGTHRKSWADIYPQVKPSEWTPELGSFLDGLLSFHPRKRLTVKEALRHPYLRELFDAADDVECPEPVDWAFDDGLEMSKRAIQNAIWECSSSFHPELRERDASWFAQRGLKMPQSRRSRSNSLAA